MGRPVGELPYGVQKRIEVGRALAIEPKVLLLDEPVAGMTPAETDAMAELILDIQEGLRIAIILVEHDMHMVMDLAERIVALDFGELLAMGTPMEVAGHEAVITLPISEAGEAMEKFFQLLVAGIAVGGIYALIALGFVVVYKVSGTFNFAQAGFVLMGAFVTYQYGDDWGLPFFAALLLAMVTMATVAVVIERLVIRPMVGKPPFAMLLVTIGVLAIVEQLVRSIWTDAGLVLSTPWGNDRFEVAGVSIRHADLWTMGFTALLLLGFFGAVLPHRHGPRHPSHRLRPGVRRGPGHPDRALVLGLVGDRRCRGRRGRRDADQPQRIGPLPRSGSHLPAGAAGDDHRWARLHRRRRGWWGHRRPSPRSWPRDISTTNPWGTWPASPPYLVMVVVLLWRPSGLFGTRAVERV